MDPIGVVTRSSTVTGWQPNISLRGAHRGVLVRVDLDGAAPDNGHPAHDEYVVELSGFHWKCVEETGLDSCRHTRFDPPRIGVEPQRFKSPIAGWGPTDRVLAEELGRGRQIGEHPALEALRRNYVYIHIDRDIGRLDLHVQMSGGLHRRDNGMFMDAREDPSTCELREPGCAMSTRDIYPGADTAGTIPLHGNSVSRAFAAVADLWGEPLRPEASQPDQANTGEGSSADQLRAEATRQHLLRDPRVESVIDEKSALDRSRHPRN